MFSQIKERYFKHILSQLARPFWHPQQVWYRDKKGLFSLQGRRTSPLTTCALQNTSAFVSKNMERTLKQFLKIRYQQFMFIFSYKNSISKYLATAYEKNTWKICKKNWMKSQHYALESVPLNSDSSTTLQPVCPTKSALSGKNLMAN